MFTKAILLSTFLALVFAFESYRFAGFISCLKKFMSGSGATHDATGLELSRHNFDLLMESILKVFPEVMSPIKPIDPSKVVDNPPTWTKAKSGNGWRRALAQDSQRLFHESDVQNDFLSRYVVSPPGGKSKGKMLEAMLDELDEMELLDSLDEYIKGEHTENPLEVAEKFVIEGLSESFAPFDRSMDPLKVEDNARPFVKSVKLSEVRKAIKANPEYFK